MLQTLQLFFGDANAAEARVYASALGAKSQPGLSLRGSIIGPLCEYAQTLSATVPLVDRGPGDSLLAQAIVPDPCFWTPELPYLYLAKIELCRGGQVIESDERPFGIRPLGARGQRFWYAGQSWVLCAVCRDATPLAEIDDWRNAAAAMFVDSPDDGFCEEASRRGVLLAVSVPAAELMNELRRLARWPAVAFVVVDTHLPIGIRPKDYARNVVMVQQFSGQRPMVPATWADAVLCQVESAEQLQSQIANCSLPVIAYRPAAEPADVAAARRLCDTLQSDLAGGREIAGYVV